MITRRTALVVIAVLTALAALPQMAAAEKPQLGPLNPAFVEALHDPLVGLGLGRMPSPVQVHVGAAAQARAARMKFPSVYDLRTQNRLTPIKDQDAHNGLHAYNTCWSFGNTAAVESKLLSATPQPSTVPDLSEDNLVRRSGFLPTMADRYDMGGYDFMAVAYFARWAGPVAEASDPYDGRAGADGTVAHVQGVVTLPGRSGPLDNDRIKQLVMANGALSVGMYYNLYLSTVLNAATSAYYDPVQEGENHGVDIIGWDDDYPASNFRTTPTGNGAFLVRNSWGAGWGSGGYFWVSYFDQSFAMEQDLGLYGGMTSYSRVDGVGNYSHNYGYDKLGVTGQLGYKSGVPIWGANRFTAVSNRRITAVGFYTLSSGTPYEIWAGRSFATLTRRGVGTSSLPGYETVSLTTPLRVTKGQPFIVAIKLKSPDRTFPLPIEQRTVTSYGDGGSIVLAPATAKAGQSFVAATRGGLRTGTLSTANVCLKAFAQ